MSSKNVTQRIKELILDDGYRSYAKLPDDLKYELTALSINALGRHGYEALVEGNNTDGCVEDLITHLLNGTFESADALANTMQKNAESYFAAELSDLFEECRQELNGELNREAGLHPITDHTNGETRWVR